MKIKIILVTIAIMGWSLAFYGIVNSVKTEYIESPTVEVLPDHSNCQYPNRLSNPPDGCDNSDPARPECVTKFGTEDCDIPYPEQLEIIEVPLVVTTIELEPTTVDSCK